jgi:hypothetical protein
MLNCKGRAVALVTQNLILQVFKLENGQILFSWYACSHIKHHKPEQIHLFAEFYGFIKFYGLPRLG